MDFSEIYTDFRQIWQNRPEMLILLAAGFMVFVFIVIDAWRHKRRRKRHPVKPDWRR